MYERIRKYPFRFTFVSFSLSQQLMNTAIVSYLWEFTYYNLTQNEEYLANRPANRGEDLVEIARRLSNCEILP